MDAVPNEIKSRVCDHIITASGEQASLARTTLKNLRLTCRTWSDVPLSYLIGEYIVSLWGSGLRNLSMIAKHSHLAYHVVALEFRVDFNIAEPHPAPYTRLNKKRSSVANPRKNSLRRLVSALKSPKNSNAESSLRRSSSSSGVNMDQLLTQFETLAQETIANNMGRSCVANGFTSSVTQISAVLSEVLSKFPRLKRLTINNGTQSNFMHNLTYEDVLRWAPTQDTWSRISEEINSELFLALIRSGAKVSQLRLRGGSVAWFVHFYNTVNESPAKTNLLRCLNEFVMGVDSLQIRFETGAYQKDVDVVESSGSGLGRLLHSIIPRASNTMTLDILAHDVEFFGTINTENILTSGDFSKLSKLTTLTLGDMSFTTELLIALLRSLSTTLVSLCLGTAGLKDGSWVQILHQLQKDLNLQTFRLVGLHYIERGGQWNVSRKVDGGRCLLVAMEEFVTHQGESGLPTLEEDRGAMQIWKSRSDSSMEWFPKP